MQGVCLWWGKEEVQNSRVRSRLDVWAEMRLVKENMGLMNYRLRRTPVGWIEDGVAVYSSAAHL